uniref:nicotinamide-nucleotide amidase n=1 Tax=Vibrio anguillarum TaxID=55601 RepID=UPI0040471633
MKAIFELSEQLGQQLLAQKEILTSAESCTGGGVAFALTEVAGSSAWFERSFVTYSNLAKQEMLGVKAQTLVDFGAVSEPVVREMVQGALLHSQATIGVAISGIAGPDGGSAEKPVGTVCFAWASKQGWERAETLCFKGDRAQVRKQAITHALQVVSHFLSQPN